MKLKEFSSLLFKAVNEGADSAIAMHHCLENNISKAEAYRLYGRSNVDRWISEGLISPACLDAKTETIQINKTKLEAVAASSNRLTYLPVADR